MAGREVAVAGGDGTRLAAEVEGAGPPLVLVHGTTSDRTRWAGVLPALAARFTCWAMDRRGCGASADGPHSLEHDAADVAAVCRAAGPGASLLGHSYGALAALEAAPRVPGLARLVLYEPPAYPVEVRDRLYPPGIAGDLQARLDRGDREGVVEHMFRALAGMGDADIAGLRALPTWPKRVAAAHTVPRETRVEAAWAFRPGAWRGLRTPTLLLLGGASAEPARAGAEMLRRGLPDARIAELPGQGHVAMGTAPEMFLAAVLGFLAPAGTTGSGSGSGPGPPARA